jgi:multidrug efflux pump
MRCASGSTPASSTATSSPPIDVNAAIVAQNVQVAAGQLGALPVAAGQQLNATVNSQSRLQTPEQFRKILLRTGQGAATVYLSDVARVELGSESYTVAGRYNGQSASGLAIKLAVRRQCDQHRRLASGRSSRCCSGIFRQG